MKRAVQLLSFLCLSGALLWAADSPFTGKWKLNPRRSTLTDEMRVKSVGGNRYDFNLGGSTVETITVDGTEQPGSFDTTLTVTPEADNRWRVERKKDGHTTIVGIWTLSADGTTLTDSFTSYRANGTTFHLDYVYKREGAGKGFDGTWVSTTEDVSSAYEIVVTPYGDDGISVNYTSFGLLKQMKFDGKDYPCTGAVAPAGCTSAATKQDERTIEIVDKIKDKQIDSQKVTVSADGKTMTFTLHIAGRDHAQIQVFDRE